MSFVQGTRADDDPINGFRYMTQKVRRRKWRRRLRNAAVWASVIPVGAAVWFFYAPQAENLRLAWLARDLVPIQSDVAADEGDAEFSIASADERRDPIIFIPQNASDVTRNTVEVRFEETNEAAQSGRVFYMRDALDSGSLKFQPVLPASAADFALLSARTADDMAVAADTTAVRTQTVYAGDDTGDGAGWVDTGVEPSGRTAPAPEPSVQTVGTSVLEILPETSRALTAQDHFLRATADRPLPAILREIGVRSSQAAEVTKGAILQLNQQVVPAGGVIAVRLAPGQNGGVVTHVSIYDERGRRGSIGRLPEGGFVAMDDPWSSTDLARFTDAGNGDAANRHRLLDVLYSAGLRNGVAPDVVSDMVRMMAQAYDLDDFLLPQDSVEILYSDRPRDAASDGGRILYAAINRRDRTLACYFLKPGRDDPFTCMTEKDTIAQFNGTAGFVVPVKGSLRSGFGQRMHPILKRLRLHAGVDWAAASGTPVHAAMDGTVLRNGDSGGYGNLVVLSHGAGLETRYAHLSEFAPGLKAGTPVKAGELIGFVGTTGLSTGPHLHFELRANGEPVDPLNYRPYAEPEVTGEKEKLVARIIKVESGGKAHAKNPRSSATGLGQFISSTWLRMIRSYRPDLAQSLSEEQVLALRYDPDISREMTHNFAAENEAELLSAGLRATAGNLYLAHFLGSGGAKTVLRADPSTPLSALLPPQVFSANNFLYGRDAEWVINWAARKMNSAVVSSQPSFQIPVAERVRSQRYAAYSKAIDTMMEAIRAQDQAAM